MARIYDKYREIDIEVGPAQAEAMAKWRPNRYVLPSEVEDDVSEGYVIGNPKLALLNANGDIELDVELPDGVKMSDLSNHILTEFDNSDVDATRGAVKLADENSINLNDIYEGERINKQTVQNYIDGQN